MLLPLSAFDRAQASKRKLVLEACAELDAGRQLELVKLGELSREITEGLS
jgi:hypothetical protein